MILQLHNDQPEYKFHNYTVARYKLVVFVGLDWREQLKRRPLSLWEAILSPSA